MRKLMDQDRLHLTSHRALETFRGTKPSSNAMKNNGAVADHLLTAVRHNVAASTALAPRVVNTKVLNLLLNYIDAAAMSDHGKGEKRQARKGQTTDEQNAPWDLWHLPEVAFGFRV